MTTTNLLVNGDMEGPYSGGVAPGWTRIAAPPASMALSADTTVPLLGASDQTIAFVATPGSTDSAGIYQVVTLPTSGGSVLRAQPYCISVYVMMESQFQQWRSWQFNVKWYNGSGTLLQTDTASSPTDFEFNYPSPDAWFRSSLFVTCPSGAVSARIELLASSGGTTVTAPGDVVHFDGAQFEYCDLYATNLSSPPLAPVLMGTADWSTMQSHGIMSSGSELPDAWDPSIYASGGYTVSPVSSPALHGTAAQIATTSLGGASSINGMTVGDLMNRADYQVGGATSASFIAPLVVDPNHYAYTATMQYQVVGAALSAHLRSCLRVELLGGNDASDGGVTVGDTHGPLGEGVSSGWQTLSVTFGAGTAHPTTGWGTTPSGLMLTVGMSGDGTFGAMTGTIVIGEVTLALGSNPSPPAQTYGAAGYYPSAFDNVPLQPPAQVAVVLGGVNATIKAGSFEVDDVINQRARAQFTVLDAAAANHFQQGQSINALDGNGNLVWAGVVSSAKESRMNWAGGLLHDIIGMDWAYLCDKRVANKTYVNMTAGAIVTDLASTYLASEGITALSANIQDGPTLPAIVFDNKTVTDALKQLAQYANFAWWIDFSRNLHFLPLGATAAPFTFDGTQAAEGTVFVTHTNPLYRNRQIWRNVPVQTASQTEHFAGDNKRTTFTVGFDLASAPTITLNSVSQTVGVAGIDTGKQWYWQVHTKSITQDTGGTKLVSTDDLAVTYVGEYKSNIVSEDVAAETAEAALEGGTSGIVEVVEDALTTGDLNTVFLYASAKLKRFATTGKQLEFVTNTPGLQSGQTLTANLPIHALNNETFLVQSVTIRDSGPWGDEGMVSLWYTVVAIDGPVDSTWVDYFTALSHATDSNAANVDTQTIITILASFAAVLAAMTGSVTYTALSCPICGPSTLCGTGTIVC